MSATNGFREIPASPVLMELIQLRLNQLIDMGAKDAHLPPTARLNLERGVWTLPADPPATP